MKQYFNIRYNLLIAVSLFLVMMTASCTKWDELTSPDEGKVYMAKSGDNGELHFFRIDSAQHFYFGASFAGFNGAPDNATLSFEVDPSLISQFNEDHSYLDYNFIPLPEDSYTISSLETSFKKGASDSKPLTVTVMVNKLDPLKDYCLPIRVKSLSAGSLDTAMSISYFFIDSLYIRFHDIPGVLTVSNENNDGINSKEGSIKFTDKDYGTKYLFDFVPDCWMQLKLDAPVKLNAYEISSANDADNRDPKHWQFQGSNDGTNWTTLDERDDNKFDVRSTTYRFELNKPDGKEYSYYRLFVMENGGSHLLQMAEWRLLQYY